MTTQAPHAASGGPTTKPAITFVGVGAIGRPMALRLADASFDVQAVDPTPAGRAAVEAAGLQAASNISAAEPRDVVFVMVATGGQLLDTVRAATAGPGVTGQTWVIGSTVGPQAAREAAALLEEAGADVADAPVTGGVPGAEQGTLRILAAGRPDVLESIAALFAVLGEVRLVGERVGDGQAMKVVNQLCSSVHLSAAAEAVAFASKLGVDPALAVSVVSGGSGASWFLDERGPRMATPHPDDDVRTRLAILAKDNAVVVEEAARCGAQVPLLLAASGQYRRAAELGLLELDDSQLVRTYLSDAGPSQDA
jgi:3-hydroxyisobutyrate dehydrogenase